ncbi:MAG: hypothetical protein ACYS99_04940, partial [Planctomycetota bacterium]
MSVRPILVFLVALSLGLGLLLLIAGGEEQTPSRGIRFRTVEGGGAPEIGIPRTGGAILSSERPVQSHYGTIELPVAVGGSETFRFLAWRLECKRVNVPDGVAEDVVVKFFRPPLSAEEARRPPDEDREPSIEIKAGRAVAKEEVPEGSTSRKKEWEIWLS